MRKFLPIVLVVVALAVAIPVLGQLRPQAGLEEGRRAPEFTLPDFAGNLLSLRDLEGQVVMLNFWSAACPPCREEMPDMQRVYDDLKEDGFTILAVNVNDRPEDALRFLTDNGYTFPAVRDSDLAVARMYEVTGIPKTLILDRSGVIRQIRVGLIHEETLRRLVEEWL